MFSAMEGSTLDSEGGGQQSSKRNRRFAPPHSEQYFEWIHSPGSGPPKPGGKPLLTVKRNLFGFFL